MAIQAPDDKSGPDDKKPFSMWMVDNNRSIVCPFCGVEKQSDDRLGRHLVHEHWREINSAAKRVQEMNAR